MRTDAIPLEPVPLSADQAEVMLQRQVKKHYLTSILLHWSNAIVWLLELLTGAALITSPYFRVAPQWYLSIVEDVFGTRASLLRFHVAVGITWLVVFVVYGIFGFRAYLGREVLQSKLFLDADDCRWLVVRTLRILGRSKEPLPPQGIYNAGQKLFAQLVFAATPVIIVTGLIMAFRLFGACGDRMGRRAALRRRERRGGGPDGPRVHGRGVPRGEARLLLDDHRHRERTVRLQPPLQVVEDRQAGRGGVGSGAHPGDPPDQRAGLTCLRRESFR